MVEAVVLLMVGVYKVEVVVVAVEYLALVAGKLVEFL